MSAKQECIGMTDKNRQKLEMFENRLRKVIKIRSKAARKQNVTCFRVYDLDMPEFPFCIDWYDGRIYVAEYQRQHTLDENQYKEWFENSIQTIAGVFAVEPTMIFVKHRKVIEERVAQYHRLSDASREFIVEEGGHSFIVNLSDYLDTGVFLDHRLTRAMVGQESLDKKVLNLFAYTGTFSVYAAKGGASEVTTIDLSNTYLQWARRNFELNGIDLQKQLFIACDVMEWLNENKHVHYDLIVCDPPTFSNSKKMDGIFDVQRDHVKLINQCLAILNPGGRLYFSTNFTKFRIKTEELNSSLIKDITRKTTPFDFEGKLDRWCYLIEKEESKA
ncbi:MAG TPA: class I SAM-dependent methyltransferase [Saprospiraceae bacterium]|nr:class I SAM-dependent methyltransferase [Saprospiraceae bacterium]